MRNNTPTSPNLLEIANLTLVYLNLTPVHDITDIKILMGSSDKYLKYIGTLLIPSVNMVLEEFPWKFAITYTHMIQDPQGGYYYPDDCLRLVGVGDDHCLCALAGGFTTCNSILVGNNLSEALDNNLNRTNRYLENVSFDIIDGRIFSNVHHAKYPCCNDYKKLYYIHSNHNEMRMPNKFKDLCARRMVMNLISGSKSDPSYALKAQDSKQYFLDLRTLIEQEYEQFKTFVTGKVKSERTDVRGRNYLNGFQRSPYEKGGWGC